MTPHHDSATANWKEVPTPFEEVLSRLPEALKQEGFGVITQIDLQETFKTKLGVSFGRYRILGACNPTFAHEALTKDPKIGVLLPCNVVLYETANGKTMIGAIDPLRTIGDSNPEFESIAREVGARLARVLQSFDK